MAGREGHPTITRRQLFQGTGQILAGIAGLNLVGCEKDERAKYTIVLDGDQDPGNELKRMFEGVNPKPLILSQVGREFSFIEPPPIWTVNTARINSSIFISPNGADSLFILLDKAEIPIADGARWQGFFFAPVSNEKNKIEIKKIVGGAGSILPEQQLVPDQLRKNMALHISLTPFLSNQLWNPALFLAIAQFKPDSTTPIPETRLLFTFQSPQAPKK